MKVKILSTILVAAMLLSLAACGADTSGGPTLTDGPEISAEPAKTSETEETPEPSKSAENDNTSDGGYYANKVYYAGEDLPIGGYVINCTGTDYSMDVVIFASTEDYEDFQSAEKFTVGEYRQAVETYAWANFYLEQDEKTYVGLREGYIILLDGGRCEFSEYDPSDSQTIYPGIYVVGEDIGEEKINIRCDSDYLNMTLFDSRDNYLNYHKTDRFTYGEESDAIEKYAASVTYAQKDDSAYANLQEGMIMMIEHGMGEYSADEGPIIN